jgi:hypothetical protein
MKYWLVRGTVLVCTLTALGSAAVCGYGLHREGIDEAMRYQLLLRHFGITFITAIIVIGPSIVLFEDERRASPRSKPGSSAADA